MRLAGLVFLLWAMALHQPPKPSPPTRDPFCFRPLEFRPLEELCAPDKCPTYAAHVETLRAGGTGYDVATVGRCGRFETTHRWIGFAGQETRYFDKSGRLVAVRVESDVFLKDECPWWTHYGAVVTCRVTNVKQLCSWICRRRTRGVRDDWLRSTNPIAGPVDRNMENQSGEIDLQPRPKTHDGNDDHRRIRGQRRHEKHIRRNDVRRQALP